MAAAKTEPLPISRRVDAAKQGNGLATGDDDSVDVAESAVEPSSFRDLRKRVSRLSVEGAAAGLNGDCRGGGGVGNNGKVSLPPPHAWLAVENNHRRKTMAGSDITEEKWTRVLQGESGVVGGGGGGVAAARNQHRQMQRRSSFSVVKRERAAREAWLDRAWEMKKSWHQRNGGAPDADTPVVVVVGKGGGGGGGAPMSPLSLSSNGGGGVAMDVEEVRACRELGLELPSDCTVEIQCYGLSAASSPTHHAAAGGGGSCCSSGAASPSAASGAAACCSSPAADDPVDVKARLKVWAQAVALASTTHLGS
uniref:Uncharacterized protein n=1 Tax=Leersia perrieri TaxID=77586 RepID=A0A0D9WCJ5_9ORYZ